MKRNANTSMKLVFALSGAAVVVIVALVIQQHRPTPTMKPVTIQPYRSAYIPANTAPAPSAEKREVEAEPAAFPDLTSVVNAFERLDQKVNADSFSDAFGKARALYGPGQTFIWNGNEYSTNTADDLVEIPENQGDDLRESSGSGFAEIRTNSEGDSNLTLANP